MTVKFMFSYIAVKKVTISSLVTRFSIFIICKLHKSNITMLQRYSLSIDKANPKNIKTLLCLKLLLSQNKIYIFVCCLNNPNLRISNASMLRSYSSIADKTYVKKKEKANCIKVFKAYDT